MDRSKFTDKLKEFIQTFVQSCGDIDVESGGISPGVISAEGMREEGKLYVDIDPYGLPTDKQHMVADALQELVDKNSSLSSGVEVFPYFLDDGQENTILNFDNDGIPPESIHDFSGKFPQLMFSAMENELQNPTMEVRVADNSCLVAEFNNPKTPLDTAENKANPAATIEPVKPA